MGCVILRPITLCSATAASSYPAFDTDYRSYPAEQVRSFIVTKTAGDVIDIEVAPTTAGPWVVAASCGTAVVSIAFQVAGAWPYIRATKTGTNGVASVWGMI